MSIVPSRAVHYGKIKRGRQTVANVYLVDSLTEEERSKVTPDRGYVRTMRYCWAPEILKEAIHVYTKAELKRREAL